MSGQVAQRPRGHLLPIGAMAAVACAFTAVGLPMGIGTLDQYGPSGLVFIVIFPAIVLSLTLVGAFVAYRVPTNPIGWLLEIAGTAAAVGIFGGTYVNFDHARSAGLPLTTLIAWLASWGLLPAIGLLAIYVPLLFPTGRFLSTRWRTFGLLGLVAAAASFIAPAFVPGPLEAAPWIDNPVGIVGAAGLLNTLSAVSNVPTPIFFAGAVISVFVRYRRAGTTERQQLKWFGLVALGEVVAFVLSIPNNGVVSDIGWMVGLALMPLIPVSIGLAILRYRLYDIDRIISRTIGWGLVTGAIVLTFAGAVFGLDTMLAGFTQVSAGGRGLDAGGVRPVPAGSSTDAGGGGSALRPNAIRRTTSGRRLRRGAARQGGSPGHRARCPGHGRSNRPTHARRPVAAPLRLMSTTGAWPGSS